MGNRGFFGFSHQDQSQSFYQPNLTFPQSVLGLFAWYRPETILQASGSPIANWPDSAGNAFDLTQVAEPKKPALITNALNGYPAVRLAGAQYLQMPTITGRIGDFVTMFLVIKPGSTTPVGLFDTAQNVNNSIRNYPAGNFEWWNANPSFALGLPNTNAIALTFRISVPRSVVYYRNRTAVGTYTGTTGGVAWTYPVFVGINLGASGYYSGDYYEILLYNRTLDEVETTIIQDYLIGKYALA
jgi:hypothetical protein